MGDESGMTSRKKGEDESSSVGRTDGRRGREKRKEMT